MELALHILMDELTIFSPRLCKALSAKTKFWQVHFYGCPVPYYNEELRNETFDVEKIPHREF